MQVNKAWAPDHWSWLIIPSASCEVLCMYVFLCILGKCIFGKGKHFTNSLISMITPILYQICPVWESQMKGFLSIT